MKMNKNAELNKFSGSIIFGCLQARYHLLSPLQEITIVLQFFSFKSNNIFVYLIGCLK